MWALSHTGVLGNEEVDLLAKQAISSPESTEVEILPLSDILKIINHISSQQWQFQMEPYNR